MRSLSCVLVAQELCRVTGATHFSCVASAAHFLFFGEIRVLNIYEAMYYRLFNRTCDVMNKTTDIYAMQMIEKAHLETEEMFMNYIEEEHTPVINLMTYKREEPKNIESFITPERIMMMLSFIIYVEADKDTQDIEFLLTCNNYYQKLKKDILADNPEFDFQNIDYLSYTALKED